MNIGIAITTHNRPETFQKSYQEIKKYAPKGAVIVVVDDASEIPVKEATYRFDENVGIARAKNKCFELLEDCDHIFLFDDDTYVLSEDWYKPYIESEEPHLMYIFKEFKTEKKLNDNVQIYEDDKIKAFTHPRGCMLYFDRVCLRKVGGMNTSFGKWGWEHLELSERIYNAGLTTFKFMDVVSDKELIYSADEHQEVLSTVHGNDRIEQIKRNEPVYSSIKGGKEFVPYKEGYSVGKTAFITTYFTSVEDPQRKTHFKADKSALEDLISSLPENSQLIVLTDCFEGSEDNVIYEKVKAVQSPYFQRWVSIHQLLRKYRFDYVFCIDATDVEVLKDPFTKITENRLYTGYEPSTLSNDWLVKNHRASYLQDFFSKNSNLTLLNAGVMGGDAIIVQDFIRVLIDYYFTNCADTLHGKDQSVGLSDMGLFNYVAYKHFNDKLIFGREVCTSFKAFESNSISYFKHK